MNERGVRIVIYTYVDSRKYCKKRFVGEVEFSSAPDHFSGTLDRFTTARELNEWSKKALCQYRHWAKEHNFSELPNFWPTPPQ